MAQIIPIQSCDHFADYAEPANVVPVLPPPPRKVNPNDRYNRCILVALVCLGICVLVALAAVKVTWNY